MAKTETVKFNVGGQRYELSRSFLSLHPNTMLAKAASDQWQKDPTKEIFIDRDGQLFLFVLSYLRDGEVALPNTVRKVTLLKELVYFGVDDVDESTIDDENKETKAGYNVYLVREKAVVYRVVSECIDYFLSLTIPSGSFCYCVSHYEIHPKFVELCRYRGDDGVQALLNEYFGQVGLRVGNVGRRSISGYYELQITVIH